LEQNIKAQLRFLTCGSVDDGKSTLLGRLLYESKSVFEDQLLSTHAESRKFGTQGDSIDLALLVDGLQAEREQGITIDVAYHFFETEKRKFIAADTPGHEQYTRNMATGASTAELAIILVDASKGILTQTRRHSYIVSLFGVKNVILAVNKMDQVNFDQSVFETIKKNYQDFASSIGLSEINCIPLSALNGDNVFTNSDSMAWYQGSSLIELLETIDIQKNISLGDFRLLIQCVNRPNSSFRGFSGIIASGEIEVGAVIRSSLSGKKSKVKSIIDPSGEVEFAVSGQSVTLSLTDEIDISRGDILSTEDKPVEVADRLAAHVIWMGEDPMIPERPYVIRFATDKTTAQITDLNFQIDVNTQEHLASKKLEMNEIGYCKIALGRAVAFDSYKNNRQTGSFILIDRLTNNTVGAGVIDFALRRAHNIKWHYMKVDKTKRAQANNQKPCVLWFTGLSGSGKSTIADKLEKKLFQLGKRTTLLDGDNVRHGLNKDLGFTDQDRVENIRRIAEVSKLMLESGLITLVSFISPFKEERLMARELMEKGEFVEIFVDAPLEVCESRDPKGLYKKARAGELKNFTGIDSNYDKPENAEIVLNNSGTNVDDMVDQIISFLKKEHFV
jgi:bifunctional enzyme CysN/CysC